MEEAVFLLFFMSIGTSFYLSRSNAAETWQSTLEKHYDIVDTFDHYRDWKITETSCTSYYRLGGPTMLDGSPGPWGRYYLRSGLPDTERSWIIYAHDSDKKIGAKSLLLGCSGWKYGDCGVGSPNYKGHRGVGSFVRYVGEQNSTDGSSGYSDLYLFCRVWIPSTMVPTNEENLDENLFQYIEGNEYLNANVLGAKIINVGSGFNSAIQYHSPIGDERRENNEESLIIDDVWNQYSARFRYGDCGTWLYMKTTNNADGERRNLGMTVNLRSSTDSVNELTYPIQSGFTQIADQFGAIEMRFKLSDDTPSHLQVWIYDSEGNETKVIDQQNVDFGILGDHKWNRIMFDGNKRVANEAGVGDYYYRCGKGMECGWWVDDLILHKERISPTYFSLLSSTPGLLPPKIPTGLLLD